jgi:hypothetical protein
MQQRQETHDRMVLMIYLGRNGMTRCIRAGERGDLLLELRLVGPDELVHLLPILEEKERRGRTDVPGRAEVLTQITHTQKKKRNIRICELPVVGDLNF